MFTEGGLVVHNGPHHYGAEPVDSASMFAHVLNIHSVKSRWVGASLDPWLQWRCVVQPVLCPGIPSNHIAMHKWREIRRLCGMWQSLEADWKERLEAYCKPRNQQSNGCEDTLDSHLLLTEEYTAPDASQQQRDVGKAVRPISLSNADTQLSAERPVDTNPPTEQED